MHAIGKGSDRAIQNVTNFCIVIFALQAEVNCHLSEIVGASPVAIFCANMFPFGIKNDFDCDVGG